MATRAAQQKHEAVDAAAGLASRRMKGERGGDLARFLRQFYGHVPPDDILGRSADELYSAALSLWRFAEGRTAGRAKLRVINPRLEEHGWRSSRTVVQIVNDDMPFLVDSVTSALVAQGFTVHLIIHPILRLERDAKGEIVALHEPEAKTNGKVLRESFMQLEVSEETDAQRLAELAARLEQVLGEVRAAVEDWKQMRQRLSQIVEDLNAKPPPLEEAERGEALDFLAWLEDDNFTFLGFREYRFGGGKRGNVQAAGIKTLLTSIDGIDDNKVANLLAAHSGRDEETLDEAKKRAPRAQAAAAPASQRIER